MIRSIIFDLDGVLIESETLKADSYARAVQSLQSLESPAASAIEAYKEVVGASREVTVQHVMAKLKLEPVLTPLIIEYQVSKPWQVLSTIRRCIYRDMMRDLQLIRDHRYPQVIDLLRHCRTKGYLMGLATTSRRKDAMHVARALDVLDDFDLILTREDVQQPKPNPEIYLRATDRLGVIPQECLVIEDSLHGVSAALAAGTKVVAFATPFTSTSLHSAEGIDDARIVDDPNELVGFVKRVIVS